MSLLAGLCMSSCIVAKLKIIFKKQLLGAQAFDSWLKYTTPSARYKVVGEMAIFAWQRDEGGWGQFLGQINANSVIRVVRYQG